MDYDDFDKLLYNEMREHYSQQHVIEFIDWLYQTDYLGLMAEQFIKMSEEASEEKVAGVFAQIFNTYHAVFMQRVHLR